MKKTLVALAALAATSAFAQSTVEIYGRAHLAVDSWEASGTGTAANDFARRTRVADDSSRIGFRINEDLGGGLRAFSVIETGVNLDTNSANGQSGAANSGSGFLGSREAHVGIGNATAEVRLGRQNLFWSNGRLEDVNANLIHGGVIAAYTSPAAGYVGAPSARMDNAVQILANKDLVGDMFAGSSVWFAKPNGGEQAGTLSTTSASQGVAAKAQGFTIKATAPQWDAQYDFGQNQNTNNGIDTAATYSASFDANGIKSGFPKLGAPTLNSNITGRKLGLAWKYAPGSKAVFYTGTFSTEFTTASYNNTAPLVVVSNSGTATSTVYSTGYRKQSFNALMVQHALAGGYTVVGQYVTQGNAKDYAGADVADSGSKAYMVGIRKDLSKRTSISASYNIIDNEAKNNMQNTGGGQSSSNTIGFGSKVTIFGAGIQHNF
jgi:predicted porin